MDEILRGMQIALTEIAPVRFRSLLVRMGMAGSRAVEPVHTGVVEKRGRKAVAKVIEFYIPTSFRKRVKWIPLEQRGKVIEFCPIKRKTA